MKVIILIVLLFVSGFVLGAFKDHTNAEKLAFSKGVAAGAWVQSASLYKYWGKPIPTPNPLWHDEWGTYFDEYYK